MPSVTCLWLMHDVTKSIIASFSFTNKKMCTGRVRDWGTGMVSSNHRLYTSIFSWWTEELEHSESAVSPYHSSISRICGSWSKFTRLSPHLFEKGRAKATLILALQPHICWINMYNCQKLMYNWWFSKFWGQSAETKNWIEKLVI